MRLVPLYINSRSHRDGHGVKDVTIMMTVMDAASPANQPLLLTVRNDRLEKSCRPSPTIRLTGMTAGVQRVLRGVAVVPRTAHDATIVLTEPSGQVQRRGIPVGK